MMLSIKHQPLVVNWKQTAVLHVLPNGVDFQKDGRDITQPKNWKDRNVASNI